MSEKVVLEAQVREGKGKGVSRRIRSQGYAPGVLYGKEQAPQKIKVEAKALDKALSASGGRLINLILEDGKTYPVLAVEVQREPIRREVLHVDFNAISLTETVKVAVAINVIGEDDMVDDGGVLGVSLGEVEVECLPTDIPTHITADVSGFAMGSTLTAGELEMPEGVTLVTPEDETVLSVVAPAPEEEEEEVEEELEEAAEAADDEETGDGEEAEESGDEE